MSYPARVEGVGKYEYKKHDFRRIEKMLNKKVLTNKQTNKQTDYTKTRFPKKKKI